MRVDLQPPAWATHLLSDLTDWQRAPLPAADVAPFDLPDDAYDLVLVIMRKNHALQILPVLAANRHTPNVLFLMNNAAGPSALVDALGKAGDPEYLRTVDVWIKRLRFGLREVDAAQLLRTVHGKGYVLDLP